MGRGMGGMMREAGMFGSDGDEDVLDCPDAKCIRATDKAVLVTAPDLGKVEHWIPQSAVHDDSEVYEAGGEGKLVVKGWFARKKGWL